MCGIAGIFNFRDGQPVGRGTLDAMLGAIRHRGPDQFGIYQYHDEHRAVGMGNARLSIIDLSGGQQPIANGRETAWIVFNGEIFNYVELRAEMVREGEAFRTESDTEVVVRLYDKLGPACVQRLNGQFAFAIWDEVAQRLVIARDRMGIRPLYYTIQDGAFLFASEVKALLASGRVRAELDPVSLDQLFTFWSPLAPRTAFKEIYTLPPGHWLTVDPQGRLTIEGFWEPTFPPAGMESSSECAGPLTIDEAAGQLRELLVEATTLRLRADVPVGAYLSGGLDSSAIAALIRHYTGNHLETFSIAFSDPAFDESGFQRQMAAHLGTDHHTVLADYADIGEAFPEVIWHTEVPLLRTSPAPLYLLSRFVREAGFKVVLTGEGADEVLGGYNIFKEAKIRRFWARRPESAWRPALLRRLYPFIDGLATDNGRYLHQFFGQGLVEVEQQAYSHMIRWRNTSRTKRFFSRELSTVLAGRERVPLEELSLPEAFDTWSGLGKAQFLEMKIFLAEYLLSSQGDRMAMANSVEGRFPFLDHRVVTFCNGLPPQWKLRGLDEKYLLKRAVRDLLPEEVWNRPKRPYRAPIHRSFFPDSRPLPWVAELLSPARIEAAGYFDPQAVALLRKKLERLGRLSETDEMALAGILSTQLVHEQFVDRYRQPQPLNEDDDTKVIARHGDKDEEEDCLARERIIGSYWGIM